MNAAEYVVTANLYMFTVCAITPFLCAFAINVKRIFWEAA